MRSRPAGFSPLWSRPRSRPVPQSEGKSFNQAMRELLSEKQPSRQFVTPAQIGDLVVFLCSPAADQIRGQTIGVDGGWTAQ